MKEKIFLKLSLFFLVLSLLSSSLKALDRGAVYNTFFKPLALDKLDLQTKIKAFELCFASSFTKALNSKKDLYYLHPSSKEKAVLFIERFESDNKKVFSHSKYSLLKLLKLSCEHSVFVYFVDSLSEIKSLLACHEKNSISYLEFAGHGTAKTLELSFENKLTTNSKISDLKKYLNKKAEIFLNSCSNAKKLNHQKNLLEHLALELEGHKVYAFKTCCVPKFMFKSASNEITSHPLGVKFKILLDGLHQKNLVRAVSLAGETFFEDFDQDKKKFLKKEKEINFINHKNYNDLKYFINDKYTNKLKT